MLPLWGCCLTFLFPQQAAGSASVNLAWDPNAEPELAGYRVYYGTKSGNYTQTIEVGNTTTTRLTGLTVDTIYYAAVTSYDTLGLESSYSSEISFTASAPPELTDSDADGLSDLFESTYGAGGDLDPYQDLDGDGLVALAEYAHGLDPTAALRQPVAQTETVEIGGELYFCVSYVVDPDALNFVDIQTERRGHLTDPAGWQLGQTVEISSTPSVENPNLLEIVERSLTPMTGQDMEFFRFRHTPIVP